MLTFWLVVSLQVAGGDWQVMENVKQPNMESCLNAVAERIHRLESAELVDSEHKALNDEYEVAVTCSVHRAATNPI